MYIWRTCGSDDGVDVGMVREGVDALVLVQVEEQALLDQVLHLKLIHTYIMIEIIIYFFEKKSEIMTMRRYEEDEAEGSAAMEEGGRKEGRKKERKNERKTRRVIEKGLV